ncbi:MAG: hypothetical protein UX09_C0041G0001 [Candidatus Uhrbacteria bacterium GW2011_GWE2_45_35]|uniref:Purine nucleoside phosphorylase n=1 Tax=Candidatus Uhrbacteria bacterium GW2011_GWE2_45_35 TaxID=1618993 RepID=A0A0G1PN07_9BACT|nr:MAG: hypothetical protein UX09_C0041G0001 [Candidatus Uhrbacteria bacterium GW2011_GWE2_45_35]HBR80391.1 peptidoglycan editing factor PgeF [Candidatus Uhrbacteria bacterium]HCU32040.1 peptidoglycan editing factor PgeF [Candidatus Uhrbacteria bacterium]
MSKFFYFGTSKKSDGQMLLSAGSEAKENREKFFSRIGIDPTQVVGTILEHGTNVTTVVAEDAGKIFEKNDGLITAEKNLCLTVTVSDCLPIFFYDESSGIIGIAHAGWRGVVKGIAREMILKMKQEFSSEPEKIKAIIGPHIKKCHFEIRENILSEFVEYPQFVYRESGKIFVDLEQIIRAQLLEVGVLEENIELSSVCTFCDQSYFSWRRDKPESVVSQVAYVWLE